MINWCLCIACTLGYLMLSFLYLIEDDGAGAIIMLTAAIGFFVVAWVEFAKDMEN